MKERFVYILCFLSLSYAAQAMDRAGSESSKEEEEEIDILSMPFAELEERIKREMMFPRQRTPVDDFHEQIINVNKATQFGWPEQEKLEEELNIKIEESGHLIFMADKFGNTALHIAAQEGNKETFKNLFKKLEKMGKAASELLMTNDRGRTPLHEAAFFGSKDIVKAIFNEHIDTAGIDPADYMKRRDKRGMTALHLAAENDRGDIIQELLKNGAESCVKNNKEATPILVAAKRGYFDAVEILLDSSSLCLQEKDARGNDILYYAVEGASDLMVHKLTSKTNVFDIQSAVKRAKELEKAGGRDAPEKAFRKERVALLEQFL